MLCVLISLPLPPEIQSTDEWQCARIHTGKLGYVGRIFRLLSDFWSRFPNSWWCVKYSAVLHVLKDSVVLERIM